MINIAIDGPSGAGKSSLSRRAAEALGFLYIDTGALYRAVGLAALREGIAPDDATAVAALAERISVTLQTGAEGQSVFLNGEDVTAQLRSEQVSRYASAVSAAPRVRALLLETQRRLAAENDVVMDGRDIGTVVLPDAQLKIFLTASAEDRARRRYDELRARGVETDFQTVYEDLLERDRRDTTRAISPLRQSPDAILLDTTGNTFEESLALLVKTIRERI
ncbi:MAG: (d)CMP kinase [Clostridiales bacterium]|nr:MAG: (d)CMP kinase [Clostridiales bacterium]